MPIRIRGGIIYLDFRYRGRRLRPSTQLASSPESQKLADDWAAAIRREIRLGVFRLDNHFPHYRFSHKEGSANFADAPNSWLESHKQTWAEWTYRKFKGDLDLRVVPKIGQRKLKEITAKDLRLLREAIVAEGRKDGGRLSNRSVNRIIQPVKAMFNEMFADGEIAVNPAARLAARGRSAISTKRTASVRSGDLGSQIVSDQVLGGDARSRGRAGLPTE